MSKIFEGQLNAQGMRFALVASRFNAFIVDRLVEGARDALVRHGADPEAIDLVKAPGAFELPVAVRRAAAMPGLSAVVALGAVIRGSTPHFDYVAAEAAKGLAQVALAAPCPVAFGVLTCDTLEQAIERAGAKAGNKGADAALTAIEMASLWRQLA
jgi:6,7-dimethyl-8-ribityllumazine synthase